MIYETFINRALNKRMSIEHQIEKVARLEEMCNRATSVFGERVQSSPTNTRELGIVKLTDSKNDLKRMLTELEECEIDIIDFLVLNLKREDADILIYKYIDGKTPQEISHIKSLTEGSTRNRLSRAEKKAKERYYETYGKEKV